MRFFLPLRGLLGKWASLLEPGSVSGSCSRVPGGLFFGRAEEEGGLYATAHALLEQETERRELLLRVERVSVYA